LLHYLSAGYHGHRFDGPLSRVLLAAYAVVMTNFSYAGFTVTKDSFALGALALTLVMAITTSEK